MSNFIIIRPVGGRGVPCERTDAQTNITKLLVAFCRFAGMPKIYCIILNRKT